MVRSPLTLAALATAAVPGLDVVRARSYGSSARTPGANGSFDSALLIDTEGRSLIIRVPVSQAAETEQSADLVALRALTVGTRSRLPFDVPEFVGQAPLSGTRAVVYELLDGDSFDADALTGHAGVSGSIGRAIAAIHGLPTAFVGTAGLPQQSAQDCRTGAIDLIDRASATGYLPAALLRRWEQATDDDSLWQFAPCVVHGSLSADSFLISEDSVSGVLGWSALSVGDPARDLHWLLASRGAAGETAVASYATARQGNDPRITQRAMLYAELELARWLLHGTDTRNQGIVDDAVAMLDGLVDNVHRSASHPLSPDTGPILDVAGVENMLASTPRNTPRRDLSSSLHTDAYNLSDFGPSEFADDDDADGATRDRTGAGAASSAGAAPAGHGADAVTGPIDIVAGSASDTAGRTDDQARTRSSSE
ncbi:macrolide 2'-phosphotransferase [Cryobacterium sp. TMT1-21]|uniref:Macrolide 2'-phosphotransferase n=1 Tax=Cryobacterium shii TaxID=1259235 RepID=A0AAQ2C806_9MICO|nr:MULTISPECIES: phosphotransferase [Cryobacterium]TFC51259.1 macrolide 2'-phosphotransferase [Cryobacterium shii]TFC85229.1 macrolide 2'-phosphotransferase [Cryobacterium sp. TmT2-59]TFD15822.1 macrolide 2'-phosphotransferase [Cryobacterium sp. TMT4-10]TFD17009.1 macrolide 2'-phosphotransferase [Cryobacterium sp. TMT2-23]TFD17085.1 macrolide 2'-phosphotransferase [Cryobacterium sp. TMT1-21]